MMENNANMLTLISALKDIAELRPSSLTHVYVDTLARKLEFGTFYYNDPTPLGRIAWKLHCAMLHQTEEMPK